MTNIDDFTTTDHQDRCYLVVPVAMVEDTAPHGSPDDARWCGHVCDPASPLAGLYAFASTLDAARAAVAQTTWSAVNAGELARYGITAALLSGVYVVATTCDVYDVGELVAALADDAA